MFLKRTVAFMGMWTVFCWLLFSIAKDQNVKGKVMIKETTYLYQIYNIPCHIVTVTVIRSKY